MENCEGYACYPTPTTPSSEVIVEHVTDTVTHLATTGMTDNTVAAIIAGIAIVAGILFQIFGPENRA